MDSLKNIKSGLLYIRILGLFLFFSTAHAQIQPDSTQTKVDTTKKSKIKFSAMPMINYNRTQGAVVGAMTSVFYKVNEKDTISPPSQSMLIGIYTAEKSWMAGFVQQFYLKEDKWRAKAIAFKGNINYQFFNGDPSTNVGDFEDYTNDVVMISAQVHRKIWKRLYGGLYGEYNNSKTYFRAQNDSLDERNLSNIGYVLSQDSRDNVYYPTTGKFINLLNQFYRKWTGSDNDFNRFKLNYNQFFNLKKDQRHILIGRANLEIATGDVPFQAEAVIGQDDIRGYSEGKYRGNQLYALQSEYRYTFNESRFGLVGFAGVASAVENFSDIFDTSLLPGVGAGVRYCLIRSMKINIGVDVGVGKGDYSITFRIGESFTR